MRSGAFYMNLFLSSLIIIVWNSHFDFVDCHRRKPRRYHALRHAGGAAGKNLTTTLIIYLTKLLLGIEENLRTYES